MTIPTPQPPHVVKHSSGVSMLERSNPTMRLRSPDGGYFWVQNGYVYNDSGIRIEPPDWLLEQFKLMTDRAKGVFSLKGEEAPAEPDPGGEGGGDLDALNKTKLTALAEAEGVEVSSSDTMAMIRNKILSKREEN